MLSYPVILSLSAVSLSVLAVIVFLVSGSYAAILLVLTLAVVICYILMTFGVVKVERGRDGVSFNFHENTPAPHEDKQLVMNIKEVFHISDNKYTYDEAPAVCAAYRSELATYDQLQEAFSLGAEWCGYGWSAGGMALFPTQSSTWSSLQMESDQKKRTSCGRPGVNGGYFNPRTQFGVNCYGVKPKNKGLVLPVVKGNQPGFDDAVARFKAMLDSMNLSPFNNNTWSKFGGSEPTKSHTY